MMSGRRRVAAIDCGTNSVRLLIAEPTPTGLHELSRTMRIVRLGEAVDRTGRLSPEALARTGAVLAEYRAMIDAADVSAVRMVATSAVRDAANRDAFDAMVARTLGQRAEVVSGAVEAELSFAGAATAVAAERAVLVADIGGGSTELVHGDPARMRVDTATSLDIGSVRMTERHVTHDPPTADELAAIETDTRDALRAAGDLGWKSDDRLIGVAGTVTTMAALAMGLNRYDSGVIHGATLTRVDLDAAVRRLLAMDRHQRSAQPVIHPGRVDVIAAGAVIMSTLLAYLAADAMTVSEHDILDGIALGLRA